MCINDYVITATHHGSQSDARQIKADARPVLSSVLPDGMRSTIYLTSYLHDACHHAGLLSRSMTAGFDT